MNSNIEISIVIPCFQSSETIIELLDRIDNALKPLRKPYEVILVDDCSSDNLSTIASALVENFRNIIYIEMMFNVGQFRTTMCGLNHARGNFVITMDDDLQHPPEEIPRLYEKLYASPNLDVVIASYHLKKHSLIRNIGSHIVTFIKKQIFSQPKDFQFTSFRCMRRNLVEALIANQTHYPVIGPLILSNTKRIANLEVRHDQRKSGKSTYNARCLVRTAFDNILSFSSLPLQVISLVGITVSFVSFFATFVYVIYHLYSSSHSIMGWTSLFLAINFYGGLILLSVGFIGEYLVRIFFESKRQPLYVIRQKIDAAPDTQRDIL